MAAAMAHFAGRKPRGPLGGSLVESKEEDAMSVVRTGYRVSNCAGGTELRTKSLDRAVNCLNRLEFPGEVYRVSRDGSETIVPVELGEDGEWHRAGVQS